MRQPRQYYDRDQILNLRREGHGYASIARIVGCTAGFASGVCRQAGLGTGQPRGPLSPEHLAKIMKWRDDPEKVAAWKERLRQAKRKRSALAARSMREQWETVDNTNRIAESRQRQKDIWEAMTPEQQRAKMDAVRAGKTPEQRLASARKAGQASAAANVAMMGPIAALVKGRRGPLNGDPAPEFRSYVEAARYLQGRGSAVPEHVWAWCERKDAEART